MKHSESFLSFWGINVAFFLIAPFILGQALIVGNNRLSLLLASIISGFLLAVLNALTPRLFVQLRVPVKTEWQWGLMLLGSNTLGLWLLARYADLTGVGISSVWVAVFGASLITILQWLFEDNVISKRKNRKSRK